MKAKEITMTRRHFLHNLFATFAGLWAGREALGAAPVSKDALEDMRRNWQALLPKDAKAPRPEDVLERSRDQWRRDLTAVQYDFLREVGTERPLSSPLNDEKRPGVFACAGCGLPLFTSRMKFDSGTGWPSFITSIPGHLATKRDVKLIVPRTEYHCARCGGHHGHVFDDGPPPTRQRWCNNGVALKFLPSRMA
jgi:peptide-methionine (R)-S-oxide reductase